MLKSLYVVGSSGVCPGGAGWLQVGSYCTFPGIRCAARYSWEQVGIRRKEWAAVSAEPVGFEGETVLIWKQLWLITSPQEQLLHFSCPCQSGHGEKFGGGLELLAFGLCMFTYVWGEQWHDFDLCEILTVWRAACGGWECSGLCLTVLSYITIPTLNAGAKSDHCGEANTQQNMVCWPTFTWLKMLHYCWNKRWFWAAEFGFVSDSWSSLPYKTVSFAV